MGELPSGTVTFLFTDIEGSTRLLRRLGAEYDAALEDHRHILRDAFSSCGGVEVDTQGDAFFVAFRTAAGAVEAAVRAQRALTEHSWPQELELRVRMGIHTGEPRLTPEGYVGEDVHTGARICAAAHGGQVLVSQATAQLLPARLDGIDLRALGEHALKDLFGRHHLYQLVIDGLRSDFPPLRTLDTRPHNLPRQLSPLIGRELELGQVRTLLRRDDGALVTLTGPGGTGKTRLALALAAELLEHFSDGVFFVDLSDLTDPALVLPTVAHTLSLKESPGTTLTEALTDYLSSKELLLVLDNFEQVMARAPEIPSLLTAAPRLKFLVTSREALRVRGEREFLVSPLGLAPSDAPLEQLLAAPAVALFAERARASKPAFGVTEDNAAHVAGICRRLDGLPLALELAAARVKLLSPEALLARLDHSLEVLSSGRRDASERQRTLRGAIAWSYDLLTPDEQKLFRRLGVFAGGFTVEAAEAVCDRGDLDTEVLDGLASLVDKSLVRAVNEHEDRFSMLETIREFALEHQESGEGKEIKRAHAEFFRALVQEAEPHLIESDQKTWLDRLERDHDNMRAALAWALEELPDVVAHIANALSRFWDMRGHVTEGRRWLSRVLDEPELSRFDRMRATQAAALLADSHDDYPASIRYGEEALSLARELGSASDAARALLDLGSVALRQGDVERAASAIEEAVALSETAGDPHLVVRALHNLANVRSEQKRTNEALSLYQRGAEIAERSGDRRGVMMALLNVGELAAFAHHLDEARKSLHRVLALAHEFDDPFYKAAALVNLGVAELLEGLVMEATSSFLRALEVAPSIGSTYLAVSCLDGLAAAVEEKDPVTAARLFAASDALRARAGLSRSSGEQTLYQHRIDALEGLLTREAKEEVSREVNYLSDVVAFVRQLMAKVDGGTE